jgi:hypothetical protein
MFTGTLKFFAALAVVIGIVIATVAIVDYTTSPRPADRAKREAAQAEYDKQQADKEAQDNIEEAQQKAEELTQRPHFTPYYAYIAGKRGVECCTLYTDEINQGLVVGTVSTGERVEVLSDVHYDSVQVKTRRGLVGWLHPAKYLSLSK